MSWCFSFIIPQIPGEYYVKPLLREYKFSPSSNVSACCVHCSAVVDLLSYTVGEGWTRRHCSKAIHCQKSGFHVCWKCAQNRNSVPVCIPVHFRCSGKVMSLNKTPLSGVTVAVSEIDSTMKISSLLLNRRWVLRHASRIKRNPSRTVMENTDSEASWWDCAAGPLHTVVCSIFSLTANTKCRLSRVEVGSWKERCPLTDQYWWNTLRAMTIIR